MALMPYYDSYGNYVDPNDPYRLPTGPQSGLVDAPPPAPSTGQTGDPTPTTTTTTTPPGAPPTFTPPDWMNSIDLPSAPQFNAPAYTKPDPFVAPSAADVLNSDAFKARVKEGMSGLQNWAAARGTLNDSGTADALIDYNQNAASQEYNNEFNRQLGVYNTNVQHQNIEPYEFLYRGAKDAFDPQLQAWQAQVAGIIHENDLNYQRAWDQFMNDNQLYWGNL